jgi:membrane protein
MWRKTKELARLTFTILESSARSYGIDRVSRMSAAVAYRTMFAFAPLVLIAVFFLGLVLGDDTGARIEFLDAIERLAGDTVADAVDTFLGSVTRSANTAGLIGFTLLLWAGSSLFLELQNDLNDIFEVPYQQTTGILKTARMRGIGFLWAVALGLIVVAVWLLNSLWQFLGDFLPEAFDSAHQVIAFLAPLVSVVVLAFVFALVFETLTQVEVRRRAIWVGSFFTSVVFLAAAYGTGLYFGIARGTAVGIAGALFVILLMAYILSMVFLYGAEVTKVYDRYLETGHVEAPEPQQPEAVVAQPEPAMPLAAVLGFLAGLFVGWRRKS